MRLVNFSLKFALTAFTLLWVHLWKWCYPHSVQVVDELTVNEVRVAGQLSSIKNLLALCISLPAIARAQQIAESVEETQTKGSILVAERRWKGTLREWLIWNVIIGWIVMAMSIATSIAVTGDFLFEYGPDSGRPEIVTPYFKVVALALMAQIGSITSGLLVIRFSK